MLQRGGEIIHLINVNGLQILPYHIEPSAHLGGVRTKQLKFDAKVHSHHGHLPHSNECEHCIRARITEARAERKPERDDQLGEWTISVDLFGSFQPDVDGNIYGMIGVERGTRWGHVACQKAKFKRQWVPRWPPTDGG